MPDISYITSLPILCRFLRYKSSLGFVQSIRCIGYLLLIFTYACFELPYIMRTFDKVGRSWIYYYLRPSVGMCSYIRLSVCVRVMLLGKNVTMTIQATLIALSATRGRSVLSVTSPAMRDVSALLVIVVMELAVNQFVSTTCLIMLSCHLLIILSVNKFIHSLVHLAHSLHLCGNIAHVFYVGYTQEK